MALIYILDVDSRYGLIDVFIENLTNSFRDLGHEVVLKPPIIAFDKNTGDVSGRFLDQLLSPPCDLMLTFNSGTAELIPHIKEIPFICFLIDHPCYHKKVFDYHGPSNLIGVVDKTHLDYAQRKAPQKNLFFLPHGGSQHSDHNNSFDKRPINVLFTGSGSQKLSITHPPGQANEFLTKAMIEYMLSHPLSSYWEAATKVLEMHSIEPTDDMIHSTFELFQYVDSFIRPYKRIKCLQELDKSGIRVDIYGNNWEGMKFQNHKVHPPINYKEVLHLTTQSKCLLNVGPNFVGGAHERIFNGMLNGAVVITDETTYCQEIFNDGEHLYMYSFKRLHELPYMVKGILNSPLKHEKIALTAKDIAKKNHSWHCRAQEILKISKI